MREMIAEAKRCGGVPAGNHHSFNECFTCEPGFRVLLLWFNVGNTTRLAIPHVGTPRRYERRYKKLE